MTHPFLSTEQRENPIEEEEEEEQGIQEEEQKKEEERGGLEHKGLISFLDSAEGKVMRRVKGMKKIEL